MWYFYSGTVRIFIFPCRSETLFICTVHCTCYYYYISSVSRGLHLERLGLRNVQPHDHNTNHLWLFRDGSTAIFSCSFICILCLRGVYRYVNSSSQSDSLTRFGTSVQDLNGCF